jgi:hypothetical protein
MLDFLGTIATAGLTVFVVAALLIALDAPQRTRLLIAAVLGLWIGLAAAAGGAGWFAIARPFPVIAPFVATPLVAAALLAAVSPRARYALLGLPLPLLVGLNIGRVFAVLFLLLAMAGRLSGPFPYFAGLGDIITGLAAIGVMRLAQAPGRHAVAMHAWNAFGMADLLVAIVLGVTSAANSPLQVFAAPGSQAMQHLPFSFVPTVLVPLWMIIHAIVFAQLRRR